MFWGMTGKEKEDDHKYLSCGFFIHKFHDPIINMNYKSSITERVDERQSVHEPAAATGQYFPRVVLQQR